MLKISKMGLGALFLEYGDMTICKWQYKWIFVSEMLSSG